MSCPWSWIRFFSLTYTNILTYLLISRGPPILFLLETGGFKEFLFFILLICLQTVFACGNWTSFIQYHIIFNQTKGRKTSLITLDPGVNVSNSQKEDIDWCHFQLHQRPTWAFPQQTDLISQSWSRFQRIEQNGCEENWRDHCQPTHIHNWWFGWWSEGDSP